MFDTGAILDLDNEFKESLINFVNKEMNEKRKNTNLSSFLEEKYDEKNKVNNLKEENYIGEIIKYMEKDLDFKNDLIKKAI